MPEASRLCRLTRMTKAASGAPEARSDEIDAPSVVIAGRAATAARVDPVIHLLRKDSMRNRWTPGSTLAAVAARPGVTNSEFASNQRLPHETTLFVGRRCG